MGVYPSDARRVPQFYRARYSAHFAGHIRSLLSAYICPSVFNVVQARRTGSYRYLLVSVATLELGDFLGIPG